MGSCCTSRKDFNKQNYDITFYTEHALSEDDKHEFSKLLLKHVDKSKVHAAL